jgi:hypothetical protein
VWQVGDLFAAFVPAEPIVTYALRLPKPVIDQLRVVAEERGVRVTVLMRTWLEERLARESSAKDRVIDVDELLALIAERGRPIDRPDAA